MADGSFSLRNKAAAFVLIIITVLIVYAPSLKNYFVWDDFLVIVDNNFVKSWNNFPNLFKKSYLTPPSQVEYSGISNIGSGESSYRPVVTLSYFIDYFFWKLNPFGYHLTNLILHIANSLLLYFFIVRIVKNEKIALLASLLFAVHPVNTEAVDVISFREDLFCFLFYIASFIFFLKSIDSEAKRSLSFSIISLIFFFLALFSKEMATTLPLILILYFIFFKKESKLSFLKFRIRLLGYILVLTFYLWVRFFIFNINEPLGRYIGGSLYLNFLTMLSVFANYIQWLILPVNIHIALPQNPSTLAHSLFNFKVLSSLSLIMLLLILGIRTYKSSKKLSFSISWFFITLLPVANIIPITNYMASRYLYLPAVGFCLLSSVLLFKLSKLNIHHQTLKKTFILGILVLYSVFTLIRHSTWRNNFSVALEMVKTYPKNPLVHKDAGGLLRKIGLLELAIKEYKKAISLKPDYAASYNGLGFCYYRKGVEDKAIKELKKAIKLDPYLGEAYINIAKALAKKNLYQEAIRYLKQGAAFNPQYLPYYYNDLGVLYTELEKWSEAKKIWEKGLKINPEYKILQDNLRRLKESGY